jgi:hypothetical protein
MLMDSHVEELRRRPAAAPPEGDSGDRGESELRALGDAPSDRTPAGTTKWRKFRTGDDKYCLPRGEDEFVIGYAEEADDQAVEEIATYVPTRDELVRAVRHWQRQILDIGWFVFITGQVGSLDMRRRCYAWNFIAKAAQAIGNEAVHEAIKEVDDKFRSKVNDERLWKIFARGSDDEWQAVQDEMYRKFRERDAAETLERLEQVEKEPLGGFVAVVLRDWPSDKGKPVLVFPAGSGLSALLRASGEFEIETDKSRLRPQLVDRQLTRMGVLRVTGRDGDWRFDYPFSEPGRIGWLYLQWIADEIKRLLDAGAREKPTRS